MNTATSTATINPQELSSRKLQQLAQASTRSEISDQELSDVIAELAKRRHSLQQLEKNVKLGGRHTG